MTPNLQPQVPPTSYRLAIVGDVPSPDDEFNKQPFTGYPGKLLDQMLSKLNIMRAKCFLGNVCQEPLSWAELLKPNLHDGRIQEGLLRLALDLQTFKPNLVLLLGKLPLMAGLNQTDLGSWRGSVVQGQGAFRSWKVLPSYHPSQCQRQWDFYPLLNLDLTKALKEAQTPDLDHEMPRIDSELSFDQLLWELDSVLATKPTISPDIEGGIGGISCLSISPSPRFSFVVPFTTLTGLSVWTPEQEAQLWQRIALIMADPQIKKIWQNGLYDRFVFQWAMSMLTTGNTEDTMLKHWELYCEMEKSLGFLCSIYTKQPFYKSDRKTTDQQTFYRYCGTDSARTFEVSNKIDPLLTEGQRQHYYFNNNTLSILLYMELRGIRYNDALAKQKLQSISEHVLTYQQQLDSYAHARGALVGLDYTQPRSQLIAQIQSICCYKKNPTQPKAQFIEAGYIPIMQELEALAQDQDVPALLKAKLADLTGTTMNTKSSKFKDFLYGTCGFPVQYKKDPKTKENRPTTDYASLLKLSKTVDDPVLNCAIELSRLRTREQMLHIKSYKGRMLTSYNLVGTETGRVSSSKSMVYVAGQQRVGGNMQTIPDAWDMDDAEHPLAEGMRDLFEADPGCYIAKADLKGADGWTIGAYMAMLGDRTMLDDLLFGIKPAQVVAFILYKGADAYLKVAHDRTLLHAEVQCIKKDMWQYFVSKIGIWGTCLTGDHDVLTPKGWIPIHRLEADTPVASWNMKDQSIRWEIPTKRHRYFYNGTLYHYEGNSFSQVVTADHRMPLQCNKAYSYKTAEELYNYNGGSLPTSGKWAEGRREPLARLIAAIVSDGSYSKKKTPKLLFCFRKGRKIERIRKLLDEAGIRYRNFTSTDKRDGKVQTHFYCYNAPIVSKKLGPWLLKWDYESLAAFVDEYAYWDGHQYSCFKRLFAKDKEQLDWIATAARLVNKGYVYQGTRTSGKGSEIHCISLNNRTHASKKSMQVNWRVVSATPVYCLTVPSGYFMVRRNDKISITGNCYLMGPKTLSDNVFIQSEGKVKLPMSDAKAFQEAIYVRYNARILHKYFQDQINRQPYPFKLVCPNGSMRRFFGRKDEVLGEVLAHVPQVVTTYATLLAVNKLWNDPENRTKDPNRTPLRDLKQSHATPHPDAEFLRIEPLHQVHDELVMQFRVEDLEWAKQRIAYYFDNPIMVAGQRIVIPYDGAVSSDWSMNNKISSL